MGGTPADRLQFYIRFFSKTRVTIKNERDRAGGLGVRTGKKTFRFTPVDGDGSGIKLHGPSNTISFGSLDRHLKSEDFPYTLVPR